MSCEAEGCICPASQVNVKNVDNKHIVGAPTVPDILKSPTSLIVLANSTVDRSRSSQTKRGPSDTEHLDELQTEVTFCGACMTEPCLLAIYLLHGFEDALRRHVLDLKPQMLQC